MYLAIVCLLTIFCLSSPTVAESAPPKPPADTPLTLTVKGKSYTLAERMAVHQVAGCSVILIQGGNVVNIWNVGEASPGHPVNNDTVFPLGTLSQPLVAAAMLRAGATGKIDLDRDIASYLKSWKVPPPADGSRGRGITLRDLIEQRSGFNYHKYMGYAPDQPVPTLLQVLKGEAPAQTTPAIPLTIPGTYSLGMEHYVVLQQVIEDMTGRNFNEAIRPYLFAPLHLKHSLFCAAPPKNKQDRFAIGHTEAGTPLVGRWRVYPEVAASGLWMTPQDTANVFAELFCCLRGTGTYLQGNTAQELVRPLARDKTDDDVLAMGFGITDRNGKRVLYRGGNSGGYYCQLYANAEKGNACIVLTNRNLCWQLTNEIMASVPWE